MIDWAWIADHLDELAFRTVQHFALAAIAVGVGFAITLAVSLWVARRRRIRGLLVGTSSVLYTIPSLALFAALVPVTGLSILTAEIPLVLYTLLIFMRNILAGLDAVAAEVLETADAMGYTRRERLLRVELPLARKLIFSGVRLAVVQVWATATIAALVAGPGLGYVIRHGYDADDPSEIIAGAVIVAVLALLLELVLALVERAIDPTRRARRAAGRPAAEPVEPVARTST